MFQHSGRLPKGCLLSERCAAGQPAVVGEFLDRRVVFGRLSGDAPLVGQVGARTPLRSPDRSTAGLPRARD